EVGPSSEEGREREVRSTQGCTWVDLGEKERSRSVVSLSPLSTTHPPSFQPRWVRASIQSYLYFTLAMDRSLRFGSRTRDSKRPIRTRFPYGSPTRVNLATCH